MCPLPHKCTTFSWYTAYLQYLGKSQSSSYAGYEALTWKSWLPFISQRLLRLFIYVKAVYEIPSLLCWVIWCRGKMVSHSRTFVFVCLFFQKKCLNGHDGFAGFRLIFLTSLCSRLFIYSFLSLCLVSSSKSYCSRFWNPFEGNLSRGLGKWQKVL